MRTPTIKDIKESAKKGVEETLKSTEELFKYGFDLDHEVLYGNNKPVISTPEKPAQFDSWPQAIGHYRTGGRKPIYVDVDWYMKDGPGAWADANTAKYLNNLDSIKPGAKLNLDSLPTDQTKAAISFYSPGDVDLSYIITHPGAPYIYGHTNLRTHGTIEALGSGFYKVDLNIKPASQIEGFDFQGNDAGSFLEHMRKLAEISSGHGEGFNLSLIHI